MELDEPLRAKALRLKKRDWIILWGLIFMFGMGVVITCQANGSD